MTEQEAEIKRVISYIRSCRNAGIDTTITIDKSKSHFILNALEELLQYQALGTVEELKSKIEELKRWHSNHIIKEIKNEFVNTSTLICHNCDHKDEYIIELEAELEELREAREKQMPKKPIKSKSSILACSCGLVIQNKNKRNCLYFCHNCGQAIDWSEV